MTDSPGPPPLAASAPEEGGGERPLLPQMPPKANGSVVNDSSSNSPVTLPPHLGPTWAVRNPSALHSPNTTASVNTAVQRAASGTPPPLLPQMPTSVSNPAISNGAPLPKPSQLGSTGLNGSSAPAPSRPTPSPATAMGNAIPPLYRPYMSPVPGHAAHPPQRPQEQRYTSEEKGKGRAPITLAAVSAGSVAMDEEGRGKREKKKPRRLSAELVPMDRPFTTPASAPQPLPSRTPMPLAPTQTLPITAEDKAYFARVEANKARPALGEMSGPCPVWSNTRHGLQSAVEYLRHPSRTGGASVDIGPGGLARGVILEGQTPTDLVLWSAEDVWTILLPIGRPRARRLPSASEEKPNLSVQAVKPAHSPPLTTPDATIAEEQYVPVHSPDARPGATVTAACAAQTVDANGPTLAKRTTESAEIEALLMTHRARIPIALTVAQDYTGVPFKIPRPFIALGWFWITDAWVEPVITVNPTLPDASSEIDTARVVWRFRFEYCRTPTQPMPWWQSAARAASRPSYQFLSVNEHERSWPLVGANGSPTTTMTRSTEPISQVDNASWSTSHGYSCPTCLHHTKHVFRKMGAGICLNESCPTWSKTAEFFQCPKSQWTEHFRAADTPTATARITPESLRLALRPPEPSHIAPMSRSQPVNAGTEYWQGWVCHKCGCASERQKWHGWTCDGCKRTVLPRHIVYSDDTLRAPLRPISTGPRPDDGLASWPSSDATFAWTLFDDDIKVVRHGLENVFGAGIAIYHSLNHEGPKLSQRRINAKFLFRELQHRPELAMTVSPKDISYTRHPASPLSARPAERHLSPFYTVLLGPEPAPQIESLPTTHPIPWREANETFLNLADYINERAGQIFPGESEFNSLLVALTPPGLPASQAPRIFIPAHAYVTFAFFGSDGVLKVRRPAGSTEGKSKQGQMTLQHGDVVGIQTGPTGLEVSAQQDGFGFFCIGRQIYRIDSDIASHHHASPAPGDKTYHPRPRKLPNKPPPKPTKLPHVPLTFWYVGPFPLDPDRPLKVHPALRDRGEPLRPLAPATPLDEGVVEVKTHTGVKLVEPDQPEPKKLDPPVRPGESSGRKRKVTDQSDSSEKSNGAKVKAGKRGSKLALTDVEDEKKSNSSPAKKKARKSIGIV